MMWIILVFLITLILGGLAEGFFCEVYRDKMPMFKWVVIRGGVVVALAIINSLCWFFATKWPNMAVVIVAAVVAFLANSAFVIAEAAIDADKWYEVLILSVYVIGAAVLEIFILRNLPVLDMKYRFFFVYAVPVAIALVLIVFVILFVLKIIEILSKDLFLPLFGGAVAIVGVLLLIAFVVPWIIGVFNKPDESKPEETATITDSVDDTNPVEIPEPEPEPEPDLLADIKADLTVDLDEDILAKMYSEFSYEFLDSSMPNRNDERTLAASKVGWAKDGTKMFDAVSFPFSTVKKDKTSYTDEEIEKMYSELQEEIFRNPVAGDMFAQGIKEMKLTDGTTVYDLNSSWAEDFLAKYDKYGPEAFVTYHSVYWEKYGSEPLDYNSYDEWHKDYPMLPDYTQSDLKKTEKIYVTEEYVVFAKRALTLLDRCSRLGVEKYSTWKHWPLNAAVNANGVRTYLNKDKSYIDKDPVLVFAIDLKNGKRQVLFGFNIYDKRLEILEREQKPDKPDKPDPDDPNTPPPTTNKGKNPKEGTNNDLTAPNDDNGPGPDTNNPDNPNVSKEDENPNQNPDPEKDWNELDDINKPDPTSQPEDPNTNVDDNEDDLDEPEDTPDPSKTGDGDPIENNPDNPGEEWEISPDA